MTKKIACFLLQLALLWLALDLAYMRGFDGGAAAAQCLDLHAWVGPNDAMTSDACHDAAKAQRSLAFKLYGHRLLND